jgi:lysophospholipase L1-like esterase
VTPYTQLLTLNKLWKITNLGVSGETLATMLANAPARVDSLYNPAKPANLVIIWGGTNDIANSHDAPANVYANMKLYCAARHAVGWKVILVTMLSRTGAGVDAAKDTLNNLILADHSFADALVDFTATPLGVDGGFSNTTNFQGDGIHPTQVGINTYEVPAFSTAVNGLNLVH